MHRRYDRLNIPIELLRTFVAINDSRSVAKAGQQLDLTLSGITAQMKRLQAIIGEDLLNRDVSAPQLTKRGETVLEHALRILALNDQLVSYSGSGPEARRWRIGIPNAFSSNLLPGLLTALSSLDADVQISCDRSIELRKQLANGFLEAAFIADNDPAGAPAARAVAQWAETMVWACAPAFSVDAPLRLLGSPGSLAEQVALAALDDARLVHVVSFTASDHGTVIEAVRQGHGIFVWPERGVPPDIHILRDSVLPRLPAIQAGLYLREDLEPKCD